MGRAMRKTDRAVRKTGRAVRKTGRALRKLDRERSKSDGDLRKPDRDQRKPMASDKCSYSQTCQSDESGIFPERQQIYAKPYLDSSCKSTGKMNVLAGPVHNNSQEYFTYTTAGSIMVEGDRAEPRGNPRPSACYWRPSHRKSAVIDMNRPPTPAGPLFATRGSSRVSRKASDVKARTQAAHLHLRTGAMEQNPRPSDTHTAVYDLQTRPIFPRPGIRKPISDVSNGLVSSRQHSDLPTYTRRQGFGRQEVTNNAMPFLNEHQERNSSGKGILKSNGEMFVVDTTKQVRFGFPGTKPIQYPAAPKALRKGVKFNGNDHQLTRSPISSAKTPTAEKHSPEVSCQVKGTAIKENTNPEIPTGKIRVVRRAPKATANAFSIFRRKLQQNLDLRYSSESTALASECVLRRHEAVPHPPCPRTGQSSFQPVMKQTSRQPPTEKNDEAMPNVKGEVPSKEGAVDGTADNHGQKFSYRLAEKAEEYFTRNLRHLQEKTPTANVVKTYVVEDDPKDFLDKINKSPVSLTTKNLEMHNIWLASVDRRESYNQKVTARERRIRRWVEDMQSSSRLNHMRVVNIVVKDRGFLLQNSREDVLERMSQVPSQVPSQVMA